MLTATLTAMARILLVGKGPPDRGGIAAYLDGLLAQGHIGDHELALLNLTRDETPRGGRLTGANLRRTLADATVLHRAAAGVDVVHIHTALVPLVTLLRAGLLALVARARGKPVIVHAHSGKVQRWLTTAVRRGIVRIALAPATRVVAVSQGGCASLAAAVGTGRVALLDNGVDAAAFPRRQPPGGSPARRPPRILFAGVLTERKGLLDLFAASEQLAREGIEHEVWVAGGVPDEGPEAEAAVRAAAPSTVRFLGPQPHEAMPGFYADVDVFCLPSWWEAMPMSILEAAASGLPVVATAVGDVARAVLDGTTGFVVAPCDRDGLATALRTMLESPERCMQLGAAGHDWVVSHFGADRSRAALGVLYDEVTRARSEPAAS